MQRDVSGKVAQRSGAILIICFANWSIVDVSIQPGCILSPPANSTGSDLVMRKLADIH